MCRWVVAALIDMTVATSSSPHIECKTIPQVRLFKNNGSVLLALVRQHIPQLGFGQAFPAQKFKARIAALWVECRKKSVLSEAKRIDTDGDP